VGLNREDSIESTELLDRSVELLEQLVAATAAPDGREGLGAIREAAARSAALRREIVDRLTATTPSGLTPAEVQAFCCTVGAAVDSVVGAAEAHTTYGSHVASDPLALRLHRLVGDAAQLLAQAWPKAWRGGRVTLAVRGLRRIERDATILHRRALARLVQGTDPLDALTRRAAFDRQRATHDHVAMASAVLERACAQPPDAHRPDGFTISQQLLLRSRTAAPIRRPLEPLQSIPRFGLVPKDHEFFDLFSEAGTNIRRVGELLDELLARWPDEDGQRQEILICEQAGDRITHDIIHRLNATSITPLDREDIYAMAGVLDDIVDYAEEVADYLGLYRLEAPMASAQALAEILRQACANVDEAVSRLRGMRGLDHYVSEINRLENDGDRVVREAIASLFVGGIDPLLIIRWKDLFERLEHSIDSCQRMANILEGIIVKHA
jgi:predicted phosphate transport protein (TIGR00153 family)